MSPGMRGNLVSSIRMPTRDPYKPLPPCAMRDLSVVMARNLVQSAPTKKRAPEGARFHSRFPACAGIELIRQPIELGGVAARHREFDVGRQVAELVVDILRRFRPDTIGMREVRAPHQGLDAHILDQLGADAVVLE